MDTPNKDHDQTFQETQEDSTVIPEIEPTEAPTVTGPETSTENNPNKKNLILAAAAIVFLGAAVALVVSGTIDFGKLSSNTEGSGAVAMVNGAEVSRADYDQQVKQAEVFLASMGSTDETQNAEFLEQLKARIIDDLINGELLMQKAGEAGIEATQEDIDAQHAKTAEQVGGEEELQTQLATIGLDNEKLEEILRKQVVIERYINQETAADEVAVTDEEVREYYEQSYATMEESQRPPFEDIKAELGEQLKQQKSSEIVNAFIQQLRGEAEIEVLI